MPQDVLGQAAAVGLQRPRPIALEHPPAARPCRKRRAIRGALPRRPDGLVEPPRTPNWRCFRPDFDLLLLPHFLGERTGGAAPRATRPRSARGSKGWSPCAAPLSAASRAPRAWRDAGRTRRQPRQQWVAEVTTSRERRGRSSGMSLALAGYESSRHAARVTPPPGSCRAGGPGLSVPSRVALSAALAQ